MSYRIVVAGHLCLDLTPGLSASTRLDPGRLLGVGALDVTLGGCVANVGAALVGLAGTSDAVQLRATVGADDLGRLLADRLQAAGLPAGLEVDEQATTSYSLVLEPPGVDRTFWHHTGANERFTGAGVVLDGVDLLHLGYPPLLPAMLVEDGTPLVELLGRARAAGVTTSLDLAVVDPDSPVGRLPWPTILRRAGEQTDVLSPSLDDLTSALGAEEGPATVTAHRFADRLLDWGVAVVAISAGADGLLLRTAGAERLRRGGSVLAAVAERWADVEQWVPSPRPPTVVTTNGAGDAATAGLLHGLCLGLDPEPSARLAVTTAGAVISGRRPTPQLVPGAS